MIFPIELVRLDDGENAVTVTVLRPAENAPGCFDGEVAIDTGFVKARLGLFISPLKLDAWGLALESLAGGSDAGWMEESRGPSILIRLNGENDCPDVTIEDEGRSGVVVVVPVALERDWIAAQVTRFRRFTLDRQGMA
ncbi:DUF5959 family protein [Streptomyces xanthophaeus]